MKIKNNIGYVDADWTIENGVMVVSPKEVKFEPKDGDIVYVKASCENIIIYKENAFDIGRYVNLSDYIHLYTEDNTVCSKDSVKEIRYATEEEKLKLFDKLAEEGYEFDFEKKELVKLKWKPSMYDPYYIPFYETCEFIPMGTNWNGRNKDNIRYNKGLCFKTNEECQLLCDKLNQSIEGIKP